MTAGSTLTDGASVALLASEQWAEAHSLAPLAYLVVPRPPRSTMSTATTAC